MTEEESQKTYRQVFDDRKYVIQAAIVRIMKSRRQMMHQELVGQVLQQIQPLFLPSLSDVKKCIDLLIEQDILERDPLHVNQYRYIS